MVVMLSNGYTGSYACRYPGGKMPCGAVEIRLPRDEVQLSTSLIGQDNAQNSGVNTSRLQGHEFVRFEVPGKDMVGLLKITGIFYDGVRDIKCRNSSIKIFVRGFLHLRQAFLMPAQNHCM
jgi:hypothetical protein